MPADRPCLLEPTRGACHNPDQNNHAVAAFPFLRHLTRQWFAFGDDETGQRSVSRCAVVNAFVNPAAFDEECLPGLVGPGWLAISFDGDRALLHINIQRSGVCVTAFASTRRHFNRSNTRGVAGNWQIVLDSILRTAFGSDAPLAGSPAVADNARTITAPANALLIIMFSSSRALVRD